MPVEAPAQHSSRFLGSAKLIAACTLLSRITGLTRDILLNKFYGQGWVQDAFNYGFLVPNLFRRLFGEGALAAVFVPAFTETLDRRGKPSAGLLLGRVTGLMAVALVGLMILLELGALAAWKFAPGGPMRSLQIALTALMLPFMVSICLLALFSSILNCLNHFAAPALAPIILNVLMIGGMAWVGPRLGEAPQTQVYGIAAGVLVAGVVQLLILLPVLRGHGVSIRLSLEHRDPDVRRMLRMFVPVVIGQGVLLLSVFLDAQICTFLTRGPSDPPTLSIAGFQAAYPLAEGALSAVNNAQRLYQFPLGVLAISLATAAFPLFSLYAGRGDWPALRGALGQSIRVGVFEGLPCGLMLILLAEPIIALLFQYGRFDAQATARAAWVLKWYGLGIPAFCCQHILLRGFYSLKDTLTPMWIGCALVALNLLASVTLLWHPAIREAAFGISTSLTATLHVVISALLLRRRLGGRIGGRAIAASFARTLIAAAASGAVALWLLDWSATWDVSAPGRIAGRAFPVFLPLAGAAAVYLTASWVLRMEELEWLLPRRRPAAPVAAADQCGLGG